MNNTNGQRTNATSGINKYIQSTWQQVLRRVCIILGSVHVSRFPPAWSVSVLSVEPSAFVVRAGGFIKAPTTSAVRVSVGVPWCSCCTVLTETRSIHLGMPSRCHMFLGNGQDLVRFPISIVFFHRDPDAHPSSTRVYSERRKHIRGERGLWILSVVWAALQTTACVSRIMIYVFFLVRSFRLSRRFLRHSKRHRTWSLWPRSIKSHVSENLRDSRCSDPWRLYWLSHGRPNVRSSAPRSSLSPRRHNLICNIKIEDGFSCMCTRKPFALGLAIMRLAGSMSKMLAATSRRSVGRFQK